jgi:hypothetical protein
MSENVGRLSVFDSPTGETTTDSAVLLSNAGAPESVKFSLKDADLQDGNDPADCAVGRPFGGQGAGDEVLTDFLTTLPTEA